MYNNLEAELARRKINKKELSKKTGIPYSTLISKMTSGKFTTDEAFFILDILKIDVAKIRELFATDNNKSA